jgi:hypothetical protein
MIKISKLILVVAVLFSTTLSALADRGIGRKSTKSKVTLNISTPSLLRHSLSLNMRSGLKYTGSLSVYQRVVGNSMVNNTLITYQKGNTVYIVPYKQKVIVPEIKPGYSGMKLVIRHP